MTFFIREDFDLYVTNNAIIHHLTPFLSSMLNLLIKRLTNIGTYSYNSLHLHSIQPNLAIMHDRDLLIWDLGGSK